MGKLHNFLMQNQVDTRRTKEVKLEAFPEPFTVQSIKEKENKALRKSCTSYEFNKRTHQRDPVFDNDAYNSKLIVACCVDPNFKDAELQEMYGVRGGEELLDKLLEAGDYATLLDAVSDVNGFLNENINDLKDEAKN